MKRAIRIVAALVLLFTSVAPPATWATPTRDVYDVPNPENSSPGDDDEPLITGPTAEPVQALSNPPSEGEQETKYELLKKRVLGLVDLLGRFSLVHSRGK